MKAVIQRCDGAIVEVGGERVGGFDGPGLAVLVGVARTDTPAVGRRLAAKVWGMRLFEATRFPGSGSDSHRELSAADLGLPLLVVSQFTLYGRTSKGRRPTWEDAAPGPVAEPIIDVVVGELRALGAVVTTGVFGAEMRVTLTNDGPFTVVLDV